MPSSNVIWTIAGILIIIIALYLVVQIFSGHGI
jgi:hypothetical protein